VVRFLNDSWFDSRDSMGCAIIRRDELRLGTHISIDFEHEYFKMIRTRWGFALQEVFSELPNPEW
jgi:putative proteasome-type protease